MLGKSNIFMFVFVILLSLSGNLNAANECTKQEILLMVKQGFSKTEIDKICKETLKNPDCCCKISRYERDSSRSPWISEDVVYQWMNANKCLEAMDLGDSDVKEKYSCVYKSVCGR
ncbi:MAG: hypothetical protein HQL75_00510 [Magnetococcales bacterium]|nr:hypothetical protein [Magnetococcales bacterium]